jgi:hypothetical protein
MSVVLQAHLPGNYEVYDSSTSSTGPPICKGCWEEAKQQTTSNLRTVWVSIEGTRMAWYLCAVHADELRRGPIEVLKSVDGVIQSPRI